ncbi:hypothetical protein [Sphingobium yanoikuyae]
MLLFMMGAATGNLGLKGVMLTDIFYNRYPNKPVKSAWTELDRRFMFQASKLLRVMLLSKPEWTQNGQDLYDDQARMESTFENAHERVCDELGVDSLVDPYHHYNGRPERKLYSVISNEYINQKYDLRVQPYVTIGLRLSLIEQVLRIHSDFVARLKDGLDSRLEAARSLDSNMSPFSLFNNEQHVLANHKRIAEHLSAAILEINERLRQAAYPLNYHNGFFQFTDDQLTSDEIHEPFWSLVADPMWSNVDMQMKEAIDRRDNADRTAAFHAVSALESVIKIISGVKGWDTGNEKGAANYVDNLGSKRSDNFIEQWEAELLKKMFTDVRNPFAHGPGRDAMPSLSAQQTNWAIDTAMSWTKSLIQRM